jgi:hypothetical protein
MGLVIPISCSDGNTVGQARPMASQTLKVEMDNAFRVSRMGLGGGLVLLWSNNVELTIKSYGISVLFSNGSMASLFACKVFCYCLKKGFFP